MKVRWQDHGGGKDTAGEASAPRLVASRLDEILLIAIFEHDEQS